MKILASWGVATTRRSISVGVGAGAGAAGTPVGGAVAATGGGGSLEETRVIIQNTTASAAPPASARPATRPRLERPPTVLNCPFVLALRPDGEVNEDGFVDGPAAL